MSNVNISGLNVVFKMIVLIFLFTLVGVSCSNDESQVSKVHETKPIHSQGDASLSLDAICYMDLFEQYLIRKEAYLKASSLAAQAGAEYNAVMANRYADQVVKQKALQKMAQAQVTRLSAQTALGQASNALKIGCAAIGAIWFLDSMKKTAWAAETGPICSDAKKKDIEDEILRLAGQLDDKIAQFNEAQRRCDSGNLISCGALDIIGLEIDALKSQILEKNQELDICLENYMPDRPDTDADDDTDNASTASATGTDSSATCQSEIHYDFFIESCKAEETVEVKYEEFDISKVTFQNRDPSDIPGEAPAQIGDQTNADDQANTEDPTYTEYSSYMDYPAY